MGGAGGPITFRHIVEYCDGWMPIHGRRDILDRLGLLRSMAEEAGRDPASIEIGVFGCPPKPEVIESYAAAGARRGVFGVPPASADVVLPVLDGYAPILEQLK
jgi:hypothetical protein